MLQPAGAWAHVLIPFLQEFGDSPGVIGRIKRGCYKLCCANY